MPESFELYEALLWVPSEGYFLLERHLQRLERSAQRFGFVFDAARIRDELEALGQGLTRARKVRLELSADGALLLEDVELKPSTAVLAALAQEPIDSQDELLRHKTSRRGVYQRALASRPDAADVILHNERGELTETCAANLVLELDGRRVTPPVSSGLLPGTFREHLLERGELEEEVLRVDALERASRLFLVNSVRKWCELKLVPEALR